MSGNGRRISLVGLRPLGGAQGLRCSWVTRADGEGREFSAWVLRTVDAGGGGERGLGEIPPADGSGAGSWRAGRFDPALGLGSSAQERLAALPSNGARVANCRGRLLGAAILNRGNNQWVSAHQESHVKGRLGNQGNLPTRSPLADRYKVGGWRGR